QRLARCRRAEFLREQPGEDIQRVGVVQAEIGRGGHAAILPQHRRTRRDPAGWAGVGRLAGTCDNGALAFSRTARSCAVPVPFPWPVPCRPPPCPPEYRCPNPPPSSALPASASTAAAARCCATST